MNRPNYYGARVIIFYICHLLFWLSALQIQSFLGRPCDICFLIPSSSHTLLTFIAFPFTPSFFGLLRYFLSEVQPT